MKKLILVSALLLCGPVWAGPVNCSVTFPGEAEKAMKVESTSAAPGAPATMLDLAPLLSGSAGAKTEATLIAQSAGWGKQGKEWIQVHVVIQKGSDRYKVAVMYSRPTLSGAPRLNVAAAREDFGMTKIFNPKSLEPIDLPPKNELVKPESVLLSCK